MFGVILAGFSAVPVLAETAAVINHIEGHAWAGETYTLTLTTTQKDNERELDMQFVISCASDFPAWDLVLFLDGRDADVVPLDEADPVFGTPYPVSFETAEFEAGENWEWSELKPGTLMGTPAMMENTKLHFRDFAEADWLEVFIFRTRYTFDLLAVQTQLQDFGTKCLVMHHQ